LIKRLEKSGLIEERKLAKKMQGPFYKVYSDVDAMRRAHTGENVQVTKEIF
jgi:hypothetical protein